MTVLDKFRPKFFCCLFVSLAFCLTITAKSKGSYSVEKQIDKALTADTIPAPPKATRRTTQPQDTVQRTTRPQVTRPADSLRQTGDTLRRSDSLVQQIDTFNLRFSKDTLDAPVNYEAADSGVYLVKENKFLLYGKTKTVYKDATLTAPRTVIDNAANTASAFNDVDSTGDVVTRARFNQGSESFQSDTIIFNFKSQKGITRNTYTKYDEMWVQGSTIKKVNENTSFVRKMVMTTCDYDEPHFGFVANKGKFINNKVAVTGPVHPEFEGVPIPIYLPFGFFPLNRGRRSGLLPPQFVVTEQLGLGLTGLGYHRVINDYWDVTFLGDIYSFGSWRANLIPNYRRRYKYSGGFNISLQNTKQGFKGDPDFSTTRTFNIAWNHTMDPKAKRGISFNANVNLGSTQYNSQLVANPQRRVQNQLTSSVTYSKTWDGKNLSLSGNHSQNNLSRTINVSLPNVTFSLPTFYPFQRKTVVGAERWYEKIGFGYNGTAQNQVSFIDTAVKSVTALLDTMQLGAQHNIPITMSLPPLGKLIVSPSISYQETWLTARIRRRWNEGQQKIDTVSIDRGLYTDRSMTFGIGLNTVFFGTFNFKGKGRGIRAIRHTVRPQISFNYRPNLSAGKYDFIRNDPNSGQPFRLSQFDLSQNLYRGYGYGKSGGIGFGIDNNLEAKVRGKKDTVDRKIRLLDGFGFNGGYDFLAPSFKLSTLSLYLRSTLFEKVNLTANGNLDPYEVDTIGSRVDRLALMRNGFRFGRLTNISIALSTRFQSKPRDASKPPNPNAGLNMQTINDPRLMQDQQLLQDYMRRNPADFVDFNVPWSFDINFSFNMNKNRFDRAKQRFETDLSASLQFNNSFSLTPKWNFNTNGYYDFNTKQLTQLNLMISREMHCWQMSITVTPIGDNRFFNITISPRSAILQDLRINRTRAFYNF